MPTVQCPQCDHFADIADGQSDAEVVCAKCGSSFSASIDMTMTVAAVESSVDDGVTADAVEKKKSTTIQQKTFGDYELLDEIARGGMGVVYRARQMRLGRIVALKMIRSGQLAGDEEVRRFHAEAEAAAQLDHPNIVPIYEVGEANGQHFFSMGFVDGQSLQEHLANGPLESRAAARIATTLAEAVQYAHDQGIIHRDLKPANVLMAGGHIPPLAKGGSGGVGKTEYVGGGGSASKRGKPGESTLSQGGSTSSHAGPTIPKITDFGLAKRTEAESGMTATGQIMGTPSYMPPEQAEGRTDRIGPPADVYALGAILYCMLTGRPPFQGPNPMQTLQMVLDQDPVAPRQLNPAVNRDLETICLKCLQKDAGRRYESAGALAEDLKRYIAGEPITARAVGRVERVWRWIRRHPWQAGAVGLAGIALLIGGNLVGSLKENQDLEEARSELDTSNKNLKNAYEQESKFKNQISSALKNEQSLTARLNSANKKKDAALKQAQTASKQLDSKNKQLEKLIKELDQKRKDLAVANEKAEDQLYFRRVGLALSMWKSSQANTARRILDRCPVNRRHWEWYYVDGLLNSEHLTLNDHNGPVFGVTFSPDGKQIASVGLDGKLRVREADGGKPIRTIGGIGRYVYRVTYSRDGKRIAVGGYDKQVHIFEVGTWKRLQTLKGDNSFAWNVSFSPDGKRIVGGNHLSVVTVWDVATGKTLLKLKHPSRGAHAAEYSPNGKRIATACAGGTIHVWNAETGKEEQVLRGHKRWAEDVAWFPDGKRLASCGHDQFVIIWDVKTGKPIHKMAGHTNRIEDVAVSPDGKLVATAGFDKTVRLWDPNTGNEVKVFRGHIQTKHGVAFHPDGKTIASVGYDKVVKVWPVSGDLEALVIPNAGNIISDVAAHPTQPRFAAVGRRGQVNVRDLKTGKILKTFPGHTGNPTRMRYSPSGAVLATADYKGVVRLWNEQSGKLLHELRGHKRMVFGLVFDPTGKTVISNSWDGTQRTWSVETGKQTDLKRDPIYHSSSLSMDYSGKRIALTGFLGKRERGQRPMTTAAIRRYPDGKLIHALESQPTIIWGVVFSPDGRYVATTGSGDFVAKVWDAKTGSLLHRLEGHTLLIHDIQFSPDGKRIITACRDHTVKLWDTATGVNILTLGGFPQDAQCATFTPNGKHIIAGGFKGSIRIWSADGGKWRGVSAVVEKK